jgi:SAM-dependent methyltransferase
MPLGRLVQVLRDRRHKGEMADASYWDARARGRAGFARSVWHSQTFSQAWDTRQREVLAASLVSALDGIDGRKVADVGCGTGRITRFLAARGAEAVGFDFSPATVTAAEEETRQAGVRARFVVADVTSGRLPDHDGQFDAAITVGCLAVACRDIDALDRALTAIARLVPVGGIVQLFEPIHTSRLLARLLRAPVDAWVASARRAGLGFEGSRAMGLVPVRLAFASFDAPAEVVGPIFRAGERVLDRVPLLDRVAADYRLLRFRRDA